VNFKDTFKPYSQEGVRMVPLSGVDAWVDGRRVTELGNASKELNFKWVCHRDIASFPDIREKNEHDCV
jgi:hypothetical protein